MAEQSKRSLAAAYMLEGWKKKLITGQPLFLTFFVTARCNARCGHCFYPPQSGRRELDLDEYARIAASLAPVVKLNITGGEPFLRKDVDQICTLLHRGGGTLQTTIATNGTQVDETVRATRAILERCPGLLLELQLSIDGPPADHDRIRGVKGSFDRLMDTWRGLCEVRRDFPGLVIRFNYTFSAMNQSLFDRTHDFVRDELGEDLEMVLIRGDAVDPSFKAFDPRLYRAASERLAVRRPSEGGLFGAIMRERVRREKEIIGNVASGQRLPFTCSSGLLSGIVSETGRVHPCEMLEDSFGNLRDHGYDFRGLWRSAVARRFRHRIAAERCSCTFETALRLSMSFDTRETCRFVGRGVAAWLSGGVSGTTTAP